MALISIPSIGVWLREKRMTSVVEPNSAPLVYVPMVDFQKLEEPSIIDGF
jgi:hypothetical protein